MNQNESMIDRVLVYLFNDLLRIEEKTLQKRVGDLSMREVHIIEAVCAAQKEDNTMTVLAAMLHITVGSLTVAVKTLERKGYLQRRRSETDKRRVHVIPLPQALEVERVHREFHARMVEAVTTAVPPEELDVLIKSLHAIYDYFYDQEEA
ncbi:MAG: MarR family winged helix-turn-helix transcriptional regulator [Clostridiales bacterium]|nr:MarR family winged helix-turn-helix transcriptional regulator [Clostridiales bacterium]